MAGDGRFGAATAVTEGGGGGGRVADGTLSTAHRLPQPLTPPSVTLCTLFPSILSKAASPTIHATICVSSLHSMSMLFSLPTKAKQR